MLNEHDLALKEKLSELLNEYCLAQNEVCYILNISPSRLSYLIDKEYITPIIEFDKQAKYTKVRLFLRSEIEVYAKHLKILRKYRKNKQK